MLTQDKQSKFLNTIKIGATYEMVCKLIGVSYIKFIEWLSTQEGQEFNLQIEKTKEDTRSHCLKKIELAANKGSQAAKDWLKTHRKETE